MLSPMRDVHHRRRSRSDRIARPDSSWFRQDKLIQEKTSIWDKLSQSHSLRHRFGKRGVQMRTTPSDDPQRPVLLLNHRSSVLHPITVVHINDCSDQAMIGPMYVSADHAIGFVFA